MTNITLLSKQVSNAHRAVKNAQEVLEGAEKVLKDVQFQLHFAKVAVSKPSPNRGRKEAIKAAEEFIESLTKDNGIVGVKRTWACRIEFVVNREKRTVVAIARGVASKKVRGRGVAKAVESDVFNETIGKAIALGRVTGEQIPSIILASPNPTEIEVGQIVEYGARNKTGEILSRRERFDSHVRGKAFQVRDVKSETEGWLGTKQMNRIVDDSKVDVNA